MRNRYAAIDIGTNGVRLLMASISRSQDKIEIRKDTSVRIPIRLGEDVFSTGSISKEKESDLLNAMQGFSYLIKSYRPDIFRAVATSAFREADNGPQVVRRIYKKSRINIETISGQEEARTIFSAHKSQDPSVKNNYILIDVGGGSTEIIFFRKDSVIDYHSFKIGTVRNLKGMKESEEFERMKSWLKKNNKIVQRLSAVGTGGNINRAMKILVSKKQNVLQYIDLKNFYTSLKGMSVEERMEKYKMKSDRADVIVPALSIYLTILKSLGIKSITVPGIGLVDGMVFEMAKNT